MATPDSHIVGSAAPSPAAPAVHSPGASAVHSPAASAVHSPAASAVHSPGASAVHSPGASAVHSPGASALHSPAASALHSPAASALHSPAVSALHSPAGSINIPFAQGIGRPTSQSAHRLSNTSNYQHSLAGSLSHSYLDGKRLNDPNYGLTYTSRLRRYCDEIANPHLGPGLMETSTLRNINLMDLNNQLARYQVKFFHEESATEADLLGLRKVLHDQAEAVRDLMYIRSLDDLPPETKDERKEHCHRTFSEQGPVDAYESRVYKALSQTTSSLPAYDSVRSALKTVLPVSLTYSKDEKLRASRYYEQGYQPTGVNDTVERIARFLIAMVGALFILVPMYIMAIHQDQNKTLITTTGAVLVFAVSTSVALRMSSDQTLAATFGYAAVLMVFVGLTTATG